MDDSTALSEGDFNTERIGGISCDQIRSESTAILGLFDLLSRSWGLEVLSQFADDAGPWRFSELETELGIPPNTLSRRLKEFEEIGLLTREIRETVPPHVEYTATTRTRELQPVLQYLYLWARRSQSQSANSKTRHTNDDGETEERQP